MFLWFEFRTSNADDAIQHQVGHNDGSILHNVIVVLGEVAVLIFRWIFFTIESICRAIMPTEEIDVAGQIVLVSSSRFISLNLDVTDHIRRSPALDMALAKKLPFSTLSSVVPSLELTLTKQATWKQ